MNDDLEKVGGRGSEEEWVNLIENINEELRVGLRLGLGYIGGRIIEV